LPLGFQTSYITEHDIRLGIAGHKDVRSLSQSILERVTIYDLTHSRENEPPRRLVQWLHKYYSFDGTLLSSVRPKKIAKACGDGRD